MFNPFEENIRKMREEEENKNARKTVKVTRHERMRSDLIQVNDSNKRVYD